MKKLIFLCCIATALLISCTSHHEETELTEEQKAAIIAEVESQNEGAVTAAQQLDSEAWTNYFSKNEFTPFNYDDGFIDSYSAWVDSVASGWSQIERRELSRTDYRVKLLTPELVIGTSSVNVENFLKSGEHVQIKGFVTNLWKMEESGWKIIHHQESWEDVDDEQEPEED